MRTPESGTFEEFALHWPERWSPSFGDESQIRVLFRASDHGSVREFAFETTPCMGCLGATSRAPL